MWSKLVPKFRALIMKKYSFALSVLVGAGCFFPGASMAQGSPITDAYRQLRLLSSSTEAGISYKAFGDEWRKTMGLINIALEDSKPSNMTQKLEQIKLTYSDISNFWGCRFEGKFISVCINHAFGPGFRERNPATMEFLQEQVRRSRLMEMSDVVPAVVPVMFGKASREVRELGKLLNNK
jgi:hypothetical protein